MPSSVSGSSENGYNFYSQRIDDLEDEMSVERKKLREKAKDQEERLAQNYEDIRRKDQERLERTADTIRTQAESQSDRTKKISKDQTDQVKKAYYDRMGRTRGMDAEVLQEQVQTQSRADQAKDEKYKDLLKGSQDYHDKLVTALEEKNLNQNEALVQKTREGINDFHEKRVAEQNQLFKEMKEKEFSRYNQVQKEAFEQTQFERNQAKSAVSNAEAEKNRALAKSRESQEKRSMIHSQDKDQKQADQLQALKDSQMRQNQELKQQLDEMKLWAGRYAKEKGAGTREAIAANENEWLERERLVLDNQKARETQVSRQAEERDNYWATALHEQAAKKDRRIQETIARQSADSREQAREAQRGFDQTVNQLKDQIVKDKVKAEELSEAQARRSGQKLEEQLSSQARAYAKTIKDQSTAFTQNAEQLQRQLNNRPERQNIGDISPATEDIVKRSFMGEQQKAFDAEFERNRNSEDSIRKTYVDRMQEALYDRDTASSRLLRDRESQAHLTQNTLATHIKEIEAVSSQQLREKDQSSNRTQEALFKTYANTLDRQRREYEEMIEGLRADASQKITALRQENEFERRMEHREFALRETELVRDHERAMQTLKVENDAKLDQAKLDAQKAVNEIEKRTRQALEDQEKAFEQRLAVVESQHKERERMVAQTYEDSLDKVKRTNAQLLSKRG